MTYEDFMRPRRLALCTALLVSAAAAAAACSSNGAREGSATGAGPASVIRITGSDTMVNLVQAWAESYRKKRPDLSVQVAGGGSGVGIAGLIDGILDVAAASREMEPSEIEKATQKNGTKPVEHTVALDALSVYVHKANPLSTISLDELAEIYGEEGTIDKWTQLGVRNAGCTKDDIIRVSRQNSSGTYVYFREAVLGKTREYKQGSIDQSGSKDVVTLVGRTPCAVGYSGMAYATPDVKTLTISRKKGDPAIAPTTATAMDKTYPLARALYLYTKGAPAGDTKEFLDWVASPEGQQIVANVGFVPVK
jgi:phosphate transport system substrate-binding protein